MVNGTSQETEGTIASSSPSVNSKAWHGTLGDMHAAITAVLRESGHVGEQSARLASDIAMGVCTALGGRVVYLPRGESVRRATRDLRIFSDWRELGLNPIALAKKYRLSMQTIYEIIGRQRKQHGSLTSSATEAT
jgi:Mor family transcriptional regulator